MKKTILFLLLISSLYAQGRVYLGVSGGLYNETFTTLEASNSSTMATLKIGYGDIKSYAVEFSLDYATNSSKIFSAPNTNSNDGNKYGFNVSLLKSFDWDIYILPFIRVGFGSGFLDIDRRLQQNLSYGSFQGSLGSFVPLSDAFDLELGYEIRSTSYEGIDTITQKTSESSLSNIAYIGVNYRF
ncbi:outer membrane beta-barrel protein [Sulfurimonas sp. SAG-AH-194-L11]|nr:outer membrane beta-barrel protein [Sulfurimonas sp. SAG-AH-194-L11]MDF1876555.1 outer membrane beta-barrel protein [Sulfurimonas sp. SAG-AH-194-L11]